MKSARRIFLDFFLYFVVYSNFLSVNDFFYTLAISIFTCNFSLYCNFFVVIFFFYSESDQAFYLLTDLFCLSFCSNDLSVAKKCCYLVSQ